MIENISLRRKYFGESRSWSEREESFESDLFIVNYSLCLLVLSKFVFLKNVQVSRAVSLIEILFGWAGTRAGTNVNWHLLAMKRKLSLN